MRNVLKVHSADGCITWRIYIMGLNCTLKNGKFYFVNISPWQKEVFKKKKTNTAAGRKWTRERQLCCRRSWRAEGDWYWHAEQSEAEKPQGPREKRRAAWWLPRHMWPSCVSCSTFRLDSPTPFLWIMLHWSWTEWLSVPCKETIPDSGREHS